jgi:hypothetical protein
MSPTATQTVIDLLQTSPVLLKRTVAQRLGLSTADAAAVMFEVGSSMADKFFLTYVVKEAVLVGEAQKIVFRHVTEESCPGLATTDIHAIASRTPLESGNSVSRICSRHVCVGITSQAAADRGAYPTISRDQSMKKATSSSGLSQCSLSQPIAPVTAAVLPQAPVAAKGETVSATSALKADVPQAAPSPVMPLLPAEVSEEVQPIEMAAPTMPSHTEIPSPATADAAPPQKAPAKAAGKAPAKKQSKAAASDGTRQASLLDMFSRRTPATAAPAKRPLEEEPPNVASSTMSKETATSASAEKPASKSKTSTSKAAKKPRTETTSLKKLAKSNTGMKMGSGKHLLDDSDDEDSSKKKDGDGSENFDDDEMERRKFFQSNDFGVEDSAVLATDDAAGGAADELELCDVDFLLGDEAAKLKSSAAAVLPAETAAKPPRPELVSLIVSRQQKRPREEDSSRPVSQASLHAFFNPEVAALYKQYKKTTVTRTTEERGEWISMDVTVYVNTATNEEITADRFAELLKACVRQEIAATAAGAEKEKEEETPAATPPTAAPQKPKPSTAEPIKMRTLDSWGFGKTKTMS